MERLKGETLESYKLRRKQSQSETKLKLNAKWFYDNFKHRTRKGLGIFKNIPYVNKSKEQNKISFTQELRNQKGYSKHLEQKFCHQ